MSRGYLQLQQPKKPKHPNELKISEKWKTYQFIRAKMSFTDIFGTFEHLKIHSFGMARSISTKFNANLSLLKKNWKCSRIRTRPELYLIIHNIDHVQDNRRRCLIEPLKIIDLCSFGFLSRNNQRCAEKNEKMNNMSNR